MAGETEVRMMLESEEKALKALMALLKMAWKVGETLYNGIAVPIGKNIIEDLKKLKENNLRKGGEISQKNLNELAKKDNQNVVVQENIPSRDLPLIMDKAKEYGIPLAVIGNRDKPNVKIAMQTSDKAFFEGILGEIVAEKLAVRPDELTSFKVKSSEINALNAELKKNNITANFLLDNKKEIHCIYENADKSAMLKVLDNLKLKHKDINENFQIKNENGKITFQDNHLGKKFTMNGILEMGENELINKFQNHFGYDETKATMAVGKFAQSLTAEKQAEFLVNNPAKNVNSATEIRLENENILLQDLKYFQINMKEDGVDRFVLMDKDGNSAILTDDKEKNLERLQKIGIKDERTVEAVLEKHNAVKEIYAERALQRSEIHIADNKTGEYKGVVKLDRVDKDNFQVKIKDYDKTFSFSDKNKAVNAMSMILMSKYALSKKEALQTAENVVKNAESLSAYNTNIP
ncbi:MAG: hypothetical protein LBM93_12800 [Oscillospiraceae bacterium]|jgi:hypothetical protein|nr:hypothetical protein [Oscillospiraceae bacterium]